MQCFVVVVAKFKMYNEKFKNPYFANNLDE